MASPYTYYETGLYTSHRRKCTLNRFQMPSPDGPFDNKEVELRFKLVYYGILWPVTIPFHLYDVGKKLKRWWEWEHNERRLEEKASRKERRKNKPKPLPGKRKRALSLAASEQPRLNFLGGKRSREGQKAAILLKLPFDIRRMIWELVIPHRNISILHGKRRLFHVVQKGEDRLRILRQYKNEQPMHPIEKQSNNLLALMKTCRFIYIETITLLYTRTTFILHRNDTLSDLSSTILPSRLSSIRSLTLHWRIRSALTFEKTPAEENTNIEAPWDKATWERACKILECMSGLRELVIDVEGPFMYEVHVADMLESLRRAKVVAQEGVDLADVFRVRVPWPRIRVKCAIGGWGSEVEDRGFEFGVVRRERYGSL